VEQASPTGEISLPSVTTNDDKLQTSLRLTASSSLLPFFFIVLLLPVFHNAFIRFEPQLFCCVDRITINFTTKATYHNRLGYQYCSSKDNDEHGISTTGQLAAAAQE
jgi:hypothetical protein